MNSSKNKNTVILHYAVTVKGGIETYLNEIIPFQRKYFNKENVFLLCPNMKNMTKKDFLISGKRNLLSLVYQGCLLAKIIRKNKINTVHLHSSHAGLVGRVVSLFFWRKIKFIYCAHGWAFLRKKGESKNVLIFYIEKILSFITSSVVCVSSYDFTVAKKNNFKNIVCIKNGVSDWGYCYNPCFPLRRFLFVGRLDYQKGIDIIHKTFSKNKFRNYHLTVVGEPVLNDMPVLSSTKNISFLGWKSRDEIYSLMNQTDFLIMPSRWEGQGLTAIEAFSAGVPVIGFNVVDVIENKKNGFLCSKSNIENVLEYVSMLKKSKILDISRYARKCYTESYNSETMNNKIIKLYEKKK